MKWWPRVPVLFGLLISLVLPVDSTSGQDAGPSDEIQELLNKRQFDDAIGALRLKLTDDPADSISRLLLGRILAQEKGEPEEAVTVWRGGIDQGGSESDEAQLWWHIGATYSQLAEDGPNVRRFGGVSRTSPSKLSDEEEKAWSRERWRKATEAYEAMLEFYPENEKILEQLANAIEHLGDDRKALALWRKIYETRPDAEGTGLRYLQALDAAEEREEEIRVISNLLEKFPRSAALHQVQANLADRQGDTKTAENSRKLVAFYGWLPPFSKLEYDEKTSAIIKQLANRRDLQKKTDQLKSEKTPESSELMAAICFHHMAHGPIENTCFAELERRNDSVLLLALFHHGASNCTIRQSMRSLASLKHPEAYELIVRMLPQDFRPLFNLEAAESLAILGDDRAVGPLIEVMAPDFRESSRQTSDSNYFGDGYLSARFRAILALASFDKPEVDKVLEDGTKNPDIALMSHAALYGLTRSPKHWDAIQKGLASGELANDYRLMTFLETIDTDDARQAVSKWRQKIEKEHRAEEAKRAGKENEASRKKPKN